MSTRLIVILGVTAIHLSGFSVVCGQEKPRTTPTVSAAQDEEGQFAKKFEKQERALKVTIHGKDRYRMGDDVLLDLSLTNTTDEPLGTSTWDQFLQEKPELVKDGKAVPYRKDKDMSFEARLKVSALRDRQTGAWPQETRKLRTINLLDWYGSLEPGSYQLTIGHRFWLKGKPIKSNTVTFEIVP